MELCVAKLSQDWFPLLELLAMATNPHCKFHIYNGTRPSETVPAGAQLADDELFARPPDPRSPKVSHHFSTKPPNLQKMTQIVNDIITILSKFDLSQSKLGMIWSRFLPLKHFSLTLRAQRKQRIHLWCSLVVKNIQKVQETLGVCVRKQIL